MTETVLIATIVGSAVGLLIYRACRSCRSGDQVGCSCPLAKACSKQKQGKTEDTPGADVDSE